MKISKASMIKYKLTYAGINQEVYTEEDFNSILDVSIDNKIPHLHECGGNGKCTTCRVRILEGIENVSPKTHVEKALSDARRWDPSIRLACQCYPKGDVKVQRLIWSSGEVNQLQKEVAPEGKAEERAIAILFCDMRGFTKLSSKNTPFDIAYMLNRFYTALGEPILMNNGIIYQYVGDEIIGVFGTAGGTKQKNCMDAIRAAMGMQYALERLNRIELKDLDLKLDIGIGVNFGKAYVGHLGHPTHRQFSVIGDPVNVASRIQAQTKKVGTRILISETTHRNLVKKDLLLGECYSAMLAGKDARIEFYELLGFKGVDLALELQASLHLMLQQEDRFAAIFYDKVFAKAPYVRELFKSSIVEQGRLLTHMLGGIVYSLSRPEYLSMGLKKLGQNHYRYGVKDEYYPIVKAAMLETIDEIIEDIDTEKILKAWSTAMDFVIDTMKNWRED